ncbi:CORVET complex membrane-binding subunit VPS8 KNAG_0C06020 [Huiozyma naganishii CBS 8797]|uniref:Vacuolar protein sorting-associated protein 8 central domain-containing protein n=1 Tax=Huiozyma naganishii (strain ATCC MYA-139 / BCRC 22969 / CBS 8797 / KCTC 17520 / NBRC 10181 / NCYC 3082 / Yp74L-3) TaxID=1071383 RepID=J7S567_HUIN7|nr:hypothetical protein KNAG_0C06020 [Kazachstania naganishii CBS 8797]CCK69699.1 hypothetical protein KNAG_0C06020 [Kazachstania naganishii CBS 8797]
MKLLWLDCECSMASFLQWRSFEEHESGGDRDRVADVAVRAERVLGPESLVNWVSLSHVYSLVGAYGGPCAVLPARSYFVLGTVKGQLLIFTYQEFLQSVLVPRVAADHAETPLRSKVTHLVMSQDGTHIAAGYESGDIFLWNLNAGARTAVQNTIDPLDAILHVTDHVGRSLCMVSFLEGRHTGLVVADVLGNVVFHNGHRTGLWNLTYSSKRLMHIPPDEVILSAEASPDGNTLALLSNSKFALLQVAPKLKVLYEEPLQSKLTVTASVPQSCLNWDGFNVTYSIGKRIVVYLNILGRNTTKLTSSFDELILGLYWMASGLVGVLTVSHQFLVVCPAEDFKIALNIDLLVHDLIVPPNKHFQWYDNKMYLLTNYCFKVGNFVSWSTPILRNVQRGQYIDALELLDQFAQQYFPLAPLLSLEEDLSQRRRQLREPFQNLTFAALKFLLNNNKVESVEDLLNLALTLQAKWFPEESRETIFQFLDLTWETILQQEKATREPMQAVFLKSVQSLVSQGAISYIPPNIFQAVINRFPDSLEMFIFTLDHRSWDHDFLVRKCQAREDFDSLIYIWNVSFHDYLTPLLEGLVWIREGRTRGSIVYGDVKNEQPMFLFKYLAFIYRGEQFPLEKPIGSAADVKSIELQISYVLFNGVGIEWPPGNGDRLKTRKMSDDEPPFPYFNLLLDFDCTKFLALLNEIMENSFFDDEEQEEQNLAAPENDSVHELRVNRQYIMDILLDVLKTSGDGHGSKKIYISIFLSHSTVKYPQYIRMGKRDLELILSVLCDAQFNAVDLESIKLDAEIAIENILTIYNPQDTDVFALKLREKKFNKPLFYLYSKNGKYAELLSMYFDESLADTGALKPFSETLKLIQKNILPHSPEALMIIEVLKSNFPNILLHKLLTPKEIVLASQEFDPNLHGCITNSKIPDEVKLAYLHELYASTDAPSATVANELSLKKLYIDLSCRFKTGPALTEWLKTLNFKNVDTNDIVEALSKSKGNEEALAVVFEKLHDYVEVVNCTNNYIKGWFKGYESVDLLARFLDFGMDSAVLAGAERSHCWVALLTCLIKQFELTDADPAKRDACKKMLRRAFLRIAVSESDSEKGFSDVLAGVLEHQEVILMKANDLKEVLLEVYVTYHLEEEVSNLFLKIVEESSVDIVEEYEKKLCQGWSIHSDECDVCGKKLWGVGLDKVYFQLWAASRRKETLPEGLLVDGRLLVFKCNHAFHVKCLKNLGQKDTFVCLTCNNIRSNDTI